MTDCEFLLDILSDHSWHSTAEILRYSMEERGCGLTVHSRVAELRDPRKRGLRIEYRRVAGERAAAHQYRLVAVSERESFGETAADAVPVQTPPLSGVPQDPQFGASTSGEPASSLLPLEGPAQPTLWKVA